MKPKRRNPTKAEWFAIGTLFGVGVAAKLGIIYVYWRMRKM